MKSFRPFLTVAVVVAGASALTACTSSSTSRVNTVSGFQIEPASQTVQDAAGEEYFSEGLVGVSASPRVATNSYDTTDKAVHLIPTSALSASAMAFGSQVALSPPAVRLKRGGGREQLGRPYVVRGKRFVPNDDPDYDRSGKASWYGDAFHGRLTANGEVYDMNHLTAAHPTLPLPSYARVTNVENGRSIIVRINDRGPFAHNRIIDLSKRAAHVLGTKSDGVGEVRVQYVGPARVDGNDDAFLLASFRDGPVSLDGDRQNVARLQNMDSLSLPSIQVAGNSVALPNTVPSLPGVNTLPARPGVSARVGMRTGIFGMRRPQESLSYVESRISSAHEDLPFRHILMGTKP